MNIVLPGMCVLSADERGEPSKGEVDGKLAAALVHLSRLTGLTKIVQGLRHHFRSGEGGGGGGAYIFLVHNTVSGCGGRSPSHARAEAKNILKIYVPNRPRQAAFC